MNRKTRWGVLGTAKITREKILPALRESAHCEVLAVASRSPERSEAFAQAHGIARDYGSYEALLADPDIDIVYNPLPNDLHVPLTLQAAQAGKHVLCEKPIAMNAAEAAQLRSVADRVQIMEGFMVRFHPQWLRAREVVRSTEFGELRAVQAWFSYFNTDSGNLRNQAEHGGGALYDIGCYCITAGRFLFGSEPLRVVALMDHDPQFGTDRLASALLDFGDGRQLSFGISTQTVPWQRVQAFGTRARLELRIPFNAPLGAPTVIVHDSGAQTGDAQAQTETIAACNMYTLQCDAFAQAVQRGQPLPWGVEDAIAHLRVIDALFASARDGRWVAVSRGE